MELSRRDPDYEMTIDLPTLPHGSSIRIDQGAIANEKTQEQTSSPILPTSGNVARIGFAEGGE
jgi:hypothetical protein